LLVVTIPSIVIARAIISQAQRVNPQLQVVARISDPEFFEIFEELAVHNLVYPEFEAGLEMIRQVLLFLRIPVPEIQRHTETLRRDLLAREIDADSGYATLGQMRSAEMQFDLQWVEIDKDSILDNNTIAGAEIRKTTGVSVVGVIRNNQLTPNPSPEFVLQAGDMVAIIGSSAARHKFHCYLNPESDRCLRPEEF
jgi:CPA2 family monovalent cation:H+ antiporter-2